VKGLLGKQAARGQGSDEANGSDETSDYQQPDFHVVDFVESASWHTALPKQTTHQDQTNWEQLNSSERNKSNAVTRDENPNISLRLYRARSCKHVSLDWRESQ